MYIVYINNTRSGVFWHTCTTCILISGPFINKISLKNETSIMEFYYNWYFGIIGIFYNCSLVSRIYNLHNRKLSWCIWFTYFYTFMSVYQRLKTSSFVIWYKSLLIYSCEFIKVQIHRNWKIKKGMINDKSFRNSFIFIKVSQLFSKKRCRCLVINNYLL